jgi:hypothetical protein
MYIYKKMGATDKVLLATLFIPPAMSSRLCLYLCLRLCLCLTTLHLAKEGGADTEDVLAGVRGSPSGEGGGASRLTQVHWFVKKIKIIVRLKKA